VFTSYSVESANGLSCNPQHKLVRDSYCLVPSIWACCSSQVPCNECQFFRLGR
jgi:hypothetical protein